MESVLNHVGFEVLTAVIMKSSVFWDITLCSTLKVKRRLVVFATGFHSGFLLGLFFDSDDGGGVFLRKVDWLLTDYKALYPRRQNCPEPGFFDLLSSRSLVNTGRGDRLQRRRVQAGVIGPPAAVWVAGKQSLTISI
jgi:hypothetical protein